MHLINHTVLRAHLKRGGVIAYPTESCYGLGCDPRHRAAVQKILCLKHRPWTKGLILVAANLQQITRFILPVSAAERATLDQYWPGPYTFLLPASKRAPKLLIGKHHSLAVRISAHPEVTWLTRALGPLVSTSANVSGAKPIKTYAEAQRAFGHRVWVLPGRIGKRRMPSVIIDLQSGKKLRG
ncbi:MAG: Sua5/YciO/YrdC/YwlC family protein [Burkholderiales bacterium]|nr:Sua5/YciO/YrdC/YwlC family protein [Burkholderiales bacterium]